MFDTNLLMLLEKDKNKICIIVLLFIQLLLIMSLKQNYQGEILIGDKNIKSLSRKDYYSHLICKLW